MPEPVDIFFALLALAALGASVWLMLAPGHSIGEIALGGILVAANLVGLAAIGRIMASNPSRKGPHS